MLWIGNSKLGVSRMKNQKNMSELRFPEFSKDWKYISLGELAHWSSGGTPSKENPEYWNGSISWISASSMYEDILLDSDNKITELGLKNGSRLALKNSILILVRSSILYNRIPIGIAGKDLSFNQDVKALKFVDYQESKFIFYWLKSKENVLKSIVTGTGIGAGKLDTSQLKSLIVFKPTTEEQEKIANFLSAVDNKLMQLRRKKELLETYKRGLMQKLFSQQIRFKQDDGTAFPDWQEKQLGKICTYLNGKSYEDNVLEKGRYYLITLNSIDIDGNLKPDHKKVDFTDNSLQAEDLVMVLSDVAHGNFLGLTNIIPTNNYVLNQRMGALKPKIKVNVYFLMRYINYTQKYFKLHGKGSSQKNLSKGDVLNFPVKFPTLEEQQKIADCLTALDKKIG